MANRSLYEDITFARECVENYKKNMSDNDDNKEFIEATISALSYAESCYIDHCENIGEIAIENINEHAENILNDRFPSQKEADTYVGKPGFGSDTMGALSYRAGFLEAYRWIKEKLFISDEEVQ